MGGNDEEPFHYFRWVAESEAILGGDARLSRRYYFCYVGAMKTTIIRFFLIGGVILLTFAPMAEAVVLPSGNTQVATSHSSVLVKKKVTKKVVKKKLVKKKLKKKKRVTRQRGWTSDASTTTGTPTGTSGTPGMTGETQATQTQPLKTWGVSLENFTFKPSTLTIKKGDIIRFTNHDDVPHQVASDPHPIHTNAPILNGPVINKGETFIVGFAAAGTYTYHCHLHPNMKGTIVVE